MAKTPIVHFTMIPSFAIWCIGQHTPEQRKDLERRTKRGEYIKVRARWQGISPLKMVFVPMAAEHYTREEYYP